MVLDHLTQWASCALDQVGRGRVPLGPALFLLNAMSDQTPDASLDLSLEASSLQVSPLPVEAVDVYPPGHHELMDPRDIASIEDWGHAG